MPAKRQEPTLTIRLPADIAEQLGRLVSEQEDWSKTEVVSVALHDFLSATDEDRIKALVRYRKRRAPGVQAPPRDEPKGRPAKHS